MLSDETLRFLIFYLIAINIVTFFTFAADKSIAKRNANTKETKTSMRRVPESTLLILSLAGGSYGGAMAMLLRHHKLSKPLFFIGIPLISIVSLLFFLIVAFQNILF